MDGRKIIDFKNTNLHVLGYSLPMDKIVTKEELLSMVYTLPAQPDLIPYVTSYYKERSGFCMSENQKRTLTDERYHVVIDSTLENGYLTYGEPVSYTHLDVYKRQIILLLSKLILVFGGNL